MCQQQLEAEVMAEDAQQIDPLDRECANILSDSIFQMMVALNRARAEEILDGS